MLHIGEALDSILPSTRVLVRVQNWETVCPGGRLAILVLQDVQCLDRLNLGWGGGKCQHGKTLAKVPGKE